MGKSLKDLFMQCLAHIYCHMRIFQTGHAFRAVPSSDQCVLNKADALLRTEKKKTLSSTCGKVASYFSLKTSVS